MRIDDRRVNGRVTLEQEDLIKPWVILINPLSTQGGLWIDSVDEKGNIRPIPDSVAGAAISAAINALVPLSLMVLVPEPEPKALPFPVYGFNALANVLTIDIDKIKAGHIVEIALPSGVITVKASN